jgi:transposase
LSLRAAARVFGVGRNTISGWLQKKSRAPAAPERDAPLPAEKGDALELDELWS